MTKTEEMKVCVLVSLFNRIQKNQAAKKRSKVRKFLDMYCDCCRRWTEKEAAMVSRSRCSLPVSSTDSECRETLRMQFDLSIGLTEEQLQIPATFRWSPLRYLLHLTA